MAIEFHDKIGRECGTFDAACERAAEFANRHNGGLDMAEEFLRRAGWLHATFGQECVSLGDRELVYLNTGDTHSLTLGQEGDGPVFSTTWGDWSESAEQAYCKDTDTVRCGWCSHFTPIAEGEDWRDVVCESCGNLVDG